MKIDQTARIMRRAREMEEHARELFTRAITSPTEVEHAGRSSDREVFERAQCLARAARLQAEAWVLVAAEDR